MTVLKIVSKLLSRLLIKSNKIRWNFLSCIEKYRHKYLPKEALKGRVRKAPGKRKKPCAFVKINLMVLLSSSCQKQIWEG